MSYMSRMCARGALDVHFCPVDSVLYAALTIERTTTVKRVIFSRVSVRRKNFIFGENSPHSNKVTYGVRGNVINNFDVDFRFDSELLKEILNANKKCEEGLIKFSTRGLLHYIFKEEGCSTDYYTTRKV